MSDDDSVADNNTAKKLVFKVLGASEWSTACRVGEYAGSADDMRDGYIHLSAWHQLEGTLAKYFAGRSDLVLVAFDAATLGEPLKWEPSRGGYLFPHLYAALPAGLAVWHKSLELGEAGVPIIKKEWQRC